MNYKSILLVAGTMMIFHTANAQTSKNAKNYPVCKKHGKYVACTHSEAEENVHTMSSGRVLKKDANGKNVVYIKTGVQEKSQLKTAYEVPEEVAETKSDLVVVNRPSYKENPRLKVSYDQPRDVYEGEEVMSHDGVENNIKRNLNYLNFSIVKAPVDGGLSNK